MQKKTESGLSLRDSKYLDFVCSSQTSRGDEAQTLVYTRGASEKRECTKTVCPSGQAPLLHAAPTTEQNAL